MEGFVAEEALTAGEPGEESLARTEEDDAVSYERECVGRISERV